MSKRPASSPVFSRRITAARPTASEIKARRWHYVSYDRLSAELGPLRDADPADLGLVFVESTAKADRRAYHKRKLALVLSNERHFALEMAERGWKILYVGTDVDIGTALVEVARKHKIARLSCLRPAERELRQDLEAARRAGLILDELLDESWLTTSDDFSAAIKRPPYRMDRFYAHVRKRTGILMERGQPTGGKFSFDAENRKPWRGTPVPPVRPRFPPDELTREVLALVEQRFGDHFGTLEGYAEPASEADARAVWDFARKELLEHFGPFEDAMSVSEPDLFHTKISALLNLSRVLPRTVVDDVAADFAAGDLPLPSAEGFIRQVLGWREFVRHVHEVTDGFREPPLANALGAGRPLPPAYWGTPSGMNCLDTVVATVVRTGHSHHITRLMILGNLATLAGFSARELSDWFWLAYIDAYDWVVEPNVLGMATYADGGLMTTKPYVSGAAYINKMSDYCKGCALDPKRATGEGACPVTALYWTFLDRNRDALAGNQRIAMPLKMAQKKSAKELAALHEHADHAVSCLARGERVDAPQRK